MKKKKFIIGFIFIVVVLLLATPGKYYSTPEAALKNWDPDGEFNCKGIIATAWMGEEPVIFYVTKEGNFCDGEFKKVKFFGEAGWKIVTTKLMYINSLSPTLVVQGLTGAPKHTDKEKPNFVLYGVSKSAKADTVRINGKTPTFRIFEAGGLTYTLWYIVGSDELDFTKVNVNVTSD